MANAIQGLVDTTTGVGIPDADARYELAGGGGGFRDANGINVPSQFWGIEKLAAKDYEVNKPAVVFDAAYTRYSSPVTLLDGNFMIPFSEFGGTGRLNIYDANLKLIAGPIVYSTGDVTYSAATTLLDGNVAIAFFDDTANLGKCVIRKPDGSSHVAEFEFDASSAVYDVDITSLQNGNFMIIYRDGGSSNYGKAITFDPAGVQVGSEITFVSAQASYISCCTLTNGNVVITYQTSSDGFYMIYTEAGVLVKAAALFETDLTETTKVAALTNGNFLIAYTETTREIKITIYSAAGDEILPSTILFDTSSTTRVNSVTVLNNGNILITFVDSEEPSGKYLICDLNGKIIVKATIFNDHTTDFINATALTNGTFIIAFRNGGSGDDGTFLMFEPKNYENGYAFRNDLNINVPSKFIGREKFAATSYTQVEDPVQFETGGVSYLSSVTLLNGNVLTAYADAGDSNKGKYIIKNQNNGVIKAAAQFESGATTYIKVTLLKNGNVMILYVDAGASNAGKGILLNQNGDFLNSFTFANDETSYVAATTMQNGNIFVAYQDIDSTNAGNYLIFAPWVGVVRATSLFSSDQVAHVDCATLVDGTIVVAYANLDSGNEGTFRMFSQGGESKLFASIFEAGSVTDIKIIPLTNGNFAVAYVDVTDSSKGKIVIQNAIGQQLVAETTFNDTTTANLGVSSLSNGNFVICFKNSGGGNAQTYVIFDAAGRLVATKAIISANIGSSCAPAQLFNGDIFIPYGDVTDSDGKVVILKPDRIDVGLQLVETVTLSGSVVEIAFNSLDDGYNHKFVINDLKPVNDDVSLHMQISRNGGSSYITTSYPYIILSDDSATGSAAESSSVGTTVLLSAVGATKELGNASGENYSGEVICANPSSITSYKTVKVNSSYISAVGDVVFVRGAGAARDSITAYDALRFFVDIGNIASGTIKHYRYL